MSQRAQITLVWVGGAIGIMCGALLRVTGMPWWGVLINVVPLGWALYSGASEIQ